jgi:hypothetical protein
MNKMAERVEIDANKLALGKFRDIIFALTLTFGVHATTACAQVDASRSPGPGWVLALATLEPSSTESFKAYYWVHLPSRIRDRNHAGIWLLINNDRTASDRGHHLIARSTRSFVEFDCAARRHRGFDYERLSVVK